jgi:hypothetical protein
MAVQPIQIEVEKYLGGIDYLAHRDELVDAAWGFDRPPAVSEALAGQ